MTISFKDKNIQELTKEEIFDLIRLYLKEQIELSQRKTLDEESFNKPSWSEYQAFQLGQHKALLKVLNFLPDQGK